MSSINSRVPPLRLMAVDTPTDGQIAAYQASSGEFEWVDDSSGSPGGSADEIQYNDGAGGFAGDSGFVMNVKGSGSTTKIRVGNMLVGGNIGLQTNVANGSVSFISDGTGIIFLQSGSDAGGTWTNSTVRINCNSDTDSSILQFQNNSGTIKTTNQTFDTNTGTFTLDNTAGQIVLKGTNSAHEIQNNTTNYDTNLLIRGNGSGTPKITFTNLTKSITLQCDENNKFKVQGALYDFIFDASSGTGGITWPDGTTQTTAASSGFTNMISELPGSPSNVDTFTLSRSPVYGAARSFSSAASIGSYNYTSAWPFIAPKTGNISEMSIDVTAVETGGATLRMAIYDTNSGNLPNNLLGKGDFTLSSTGNEVQTTFSATISLTEGQLYYYAASIDQASTGGQINAQGINGYVAGLGMGTGPSDTGKTCWVHTASGAGIYTLPDPFTIDIATTTTDPRVDFGLVIT